MQPRDGYRLLDVGGGARLEQFGDRIVDRPHPGALGSRADPGAWRETDLRFDRERGWSGEPPALEPWPIDVGGLTVELRPTEAGQIGLFPEHMAMLPWISEQVRARIDAPDATHEPPSVLHVFAYTGLASLALAAAGGAVTHVDSSRPTVAWARANAQRSALADRPMRWIVDDAVGFISREIRRNRRYAGVVLDPPSYGHGPRGQAWHLERDLETLLAGAARLLKPNGFVLLTAHSPGYDGDRLATEVRPIVRVPVGDIERGALTVSTEDGRRLELGAFARWPGGA